MPRRSPSEPESLGLPRGTTDAHVHVFDPVRYAYTAQRTYTPGAATVASLIERHAALGFERAVLVQPSVYGTDNACLLDALAKLGPRRSRGIAVVDLAAATRAELHALHDGGVRGVRLNLAVRQERDAAHASSELMQAAGAIDLPGWCVQVHCAAGFLPAVADAAPAMHVPLVLDHFGGLRASDARPGSAALRALLELLGSGRVYVKLSAFYRASSDSPHHGDLAPLARTLVQARPDRLLWGSDWPHTGGGGGRTRGIEPDLRHIEPFRDVDLVASLAALRSWAGDEATLQRVLVTNPAELYGFATEAGT